VNPAREPLSFYAGKLRRGETFSLARYGDGEIHCMSGREGQTCDGCAYRPDLREALLASLGHEEPDFFYGLQRVLPHDAEDLGRILAALGAPERQWLDSGVLAQSVIDGEFFPLLDALRRMDTVVVSNADVRLISRILPYRHFIETPKSDTWLAKDRVIAEVLGCGPACYLFSCGMTACVLVSELHGKMPGSWFLDVGHVWDVFLGRNTRGWMKTMNPFRTARNLCP
jgi:hypothetical protein